MLKKEKSLTQNMFKMKNRYVFVLMVAIILVITTPLSFAASYPDPTDNFYVADYANIISQDTEQLIMDTSVPLAKATGAQIVVVTVNTLDGQDIESHTNGLFDNGVLETVKKIMVYSY